MMGKKQLAWGIVAICFLCFSIYIISIFQHRIRMMFCLMRGIHCNSPIVVFESDDWHQTGVPNRHAYDTLKKQGYTLARNAKYGIESVEDLNNLFSNI